MLILLLADAFEGTSTPVPAAPRRSSPVLPDEDEDDTYTFITEYTMTPDSDNSPEADPTNCSDSDYWKRPLNNLNLSNAMFCTQSFLAAYS